MKGTENHEAPQPWTDPYGLAPALPEPAHMDELRDLAGDLASSSRELEATLAPETAQALGENVRKINSHYSNSIEGIVSTYVEIEAGLRKEYTPISAERYKQEIGTAHVQVEKALMRDVLAQPDSNVSDPEFIAQIHRAFFSKLPKDHQFTHDRHGFTRFPVMPGEFRDEPIGINGKLLGQEVNMQIGPETGKALRANMRAFGELYDQHAFRGNEAKMVAMAAAHLKLGWLHPFRDGNGRTIRLHSTFFMAACGVNRSNLWSLSRGLSEKRAEYYNSLFIGNPQPDKDNRERIRFRSENVAMFCEDFLTIAKEQVEFMRGQLRLRTVSDRIDRFAAEHLDGATFGRNKAEAGRLLRAVFNEGSIERAGLPEILPGLSERTIRNITSGLVREGLLETAHIKAPFTIGLTDKAMSGYFPDLCVPAMMGQNKSQTKAPENTAARSRSKAGIEGLER